MQSNNPLIASVLVIVSASFGNCHHELVRQVLAVSNSFLNTHFVNCDGALGAWANRNGTSGTKIATQSG